MHGACIVHEDGSLTGREDIGRHNAVDKVIVCAQKKIEPGQFGPSDNRQNFLRDAF